MDTMLINVLTIIRVVNLVIVHELLYVISMDYTQIVQDTSGHD